MHFNKCLFDACYYDNNAERNRDFKMWRKANAKKDNMQHFKARPGYFGYLQDCQTQQSHKHNKRRKQRFALAHFVGT